MAKDTKNEPRAEAETTVSRGGVELAIRQRARMLIDAIVEEELVSNSPHQGTRSAGGQAELRQLQYSSRLFPGQGVH
jgi:hypothetical protein